MDEKEVKRLLKKYINGHATQQEKALLENWYLTEGRNQHLSEQEQDFAHLKEELWSGTLQRAGLADQNTTKKFPWYRVTAAAIILLGLSTALYFYVDPPSAPETQHTTQPVDIAPGGNKATLTLADGRTMDLSSDQAEIIIDPAELTYGDGTQIAVVDTENNDYGSQKKAALLNTIRTPKGGQYRVILPDGSQVWLNAASSLKYPTFFSGNERRVVLTGEAYFEVSSITSSGNKKMPFVVQTVNQEVRVLGTHFNISSYEDEGMAKTTLLEGAVNVVSLHGEDSRKLKPGQQSIVRAGDMKVITADPDEVIAWKNGEFAFYNEDIESVMKKIARWYDVEVIYQASVKNISIWGSVSRFKNISEVLKMIELTGSVHFKISEGADGKKRRVYVMK